MRCVAEAAAPRVILEFKHEFSRRVYVDRDDGSVLYLYQACRITIYDSNSAIRIRQNKHMHGNIESGSVLTTNTVTPALQRDHKHQREGGGPSYSPRPFRIRFPLGSRQRSTETLLRHLPSDYELYVNT